MGKLYFHPTEDLDLDHTQVYSKNCNFQVLLTLHFVLFDVWDFAWIKLLSKSSIEHNINSPMIAHSRFLNVVLRKEKWKLQCSQNFELWIRTVLLSMCSTISKQQRIIDLYMQNVRCNDLWLQVPIMGRNARSFRLFCCIAPPDFSEILCKHYAKRLAKKNIKWLLQWLHHPCLRIGNNFSQVCVSVCLSVCLCVCSGYNFWTAKARNFILSIQIHLDHI